MVVLETVRMGGHLRIPLPPSRRVDRQHDEDDASYYDRKRREESKDRDDVDRTTQGNIATLTTLLRALHWLRESGLSDEAGEILDRLDNEGWPWTRQAPHPLDAEAEARAMIEGKR